MIGFETVGGGKNRDFWAQGGWGPSSRGVGGVTHGDDLDPEGRRAGEPARPHSATIVPSVGRLLVLD